VTQQSGNQFDDDLTVGMDNDGSFSTDSIDLFEFTGDEESPIARLKTIILSIDWEINDDILQQLDDELVDLADIWADDKIKLIYIQGLNKIGKYIYKEKASANPNAIKLLITFYHNLEKIVSSDGSISEEEKKEQLLKDVKKFDQLKSQIGKPDATAEKPAVASVDENEQEEELKVLKALVLGIDWEINDTGLEKLSAEVTRLEGVFSQNKAKLILLQGLGALSSYINKMRSQSNSKSFTLLHSFYGALEKITSSELSAGEAKQLLLSEVDKFKGFKQEIAQEQPEKAVTSEPSPAKVDVATEAPVASISGDDTEEDKIASDVESRLSSVFSDVEGMDDEIADEISILEGVNVETEADDESDEDALPYLDGSVAPALAEAEEESSFSVEKLAGDLAEFADTEDVETEEESILVGVDVETEADDESDEDALPVKDGVVAPALTGSTDEGGFNEDNLIAESDDLDNRLDSFFDDEVQIASEEWSGDIQSESEQKTEEDEQGIVAALSDVSEEDQEPVEDVIAPAEEEIEESVEENLSFFDEEIPAPEGDDATESPADEAVTEDDIAEAQLSFLDEEVSAPEGDSVTESPADEAVTEDDIAEAQLSFLDEEVPAPEDDGVTESPADEAVTEDDIAEAQLSFLDEEVPAPEGDGVTESPEDETVIDEDTAEPQLSLPDEDAPASALDDVTESPVEIAVTEEEATEAQLSFLDEDIPGPDSKEPEEPFFDDQSEDVEETVSVTDDAHAPVLSDPDEVSSEGEDSDEEGEDAFFVEPEEVPVSEDNGAIEASDDEGAIAFVDEKSESPVIEEPSASDESEDFFETDEIDFTVPGEEASGTDLDIIDEDESSPDDIIDFKVPGQEDEPESIFAPIEETIGDEVHFEAVGDDAEVDLLPGEEYADSTGADEYVNLGNLIQSLHENITAEGLQDLLTEIDSLKDSGASNHTGKIFMQLLFTVCQNTEGTLDNFDDDRLSLMKNVYSGLKMNSSPDVSADQVQEHLFTSTSQVLKLQQEATSRAQTVFSEGQQKTGDTAKEVDKTGADLQNEQVLSDKSSGSDEKLKSFVQGELADIKKLFLEEITTLRKEFADK
jgi:pilus assembly protein FimV